MVLRLSRRLFWIVLVFAAAHLALACSIEDPFAADQANAGDPEDDADPDASDQPDTAEINQGADEDTCQDGVKNGEETDIDCGGPDCAPCKEHDACLAKDDCQGSLACLNQQCQCLQTGSAEEICAEAGAVCGELQDQCGNPVQCGPCTDGICEQGQCVECTDDDHCPDQSLCKTNQCISKCSPDASPFGFGSGTEGDPYLICSPEQLKNIGTEPSAYFELAADIDLSGLQATSPTDTRGIEFNGVLDGRGWEIRNFSVTAAAEKTSLFEVLGRDSQLKNLILNDVFVHSKVAASLAIENNGTISNCQTTGTITGAAVGGLVLDNFGRITQSSFSGQLSGEEIAGGLASSNFNIIDQSFTNGIITSPHLTGGLVGVSESPKAHIRDSYSTAAVHGEYRAGRLIGYASRGLLQNSFAASATPPEKELHLVGLNEEAQIISAYLRSLSCGSFESSPQETCLDYDEFLEPGAFEDWDFTNFWRMDNLQGHPVLQWE